MKNTVAVLLMIMSHELTLAQGSKVPHRMTIGDIKLKITDRARAQIQKNVDELTKNPKYFNAKVDRANQYFHFIEEVFRKEGIPEDIKYLALQESGLVSDAVSTSNAVGYWQFKDFTAVEMGLRVDRHVDERKNILAASVGAAKYMKMNNGYFDNWIYAIQAYQMGAGGALKVTDKRLYGATQMTITKKTYWYVKKYLAHKVAYQNAVGRFEPSVYLSAYKSKGGESLHEIAKKFKVNEQELTMYNKWLKKRKIPSDKKYAVIIPDKQLIRTTDDNEAFSKPKSIFVKKVPGYNQAQAKLFPFIKPWKGRSKYSGSTVNVNRLPGIIASQENKLIDLARKGNVSLSEFLNINDIEIDHRVVEGLPYYFKKKKTRAKVYYHVMHSGETLWSVSQKYGVQLRKLLMKNRLTENESVKKGRVLWMRHIRPENIPVAHEQTDDPESIEIEMKVNGSSQTENSNEPISSDQRETGRAEETKLIYESASDFALHREVIHVVRKGDTYYNIANRYKVKILKLAEWNRLMLTDKLSIDQRLRILIPDEGNQPDKTSKVDGEGIRSLQEYHIVKKGETLYSISEEYGITTEELRHINNKVDGHIAIGERLKISGNR